MRVGCLALVLVVVTAAIGCGDDDSSSVRDGGFSRRDASINQCVPYYLASGPCEPTAPADPVVNLAELSCEKDEGRADSECADLAWDFACGEHLELTGCCTARSTCGVLDPTGVLGCIDRHVFGADTAPCSADLGLDAGDEDAAADNDASAPAT